MGVRLAFHIKARSNVHPRSRCDDVAGAMREKREGPAARPPTPVGEDVPRDDDVIRIEDLAPRGDVTGGRKILLGEMLTPASNPLIRPES